MDITNHWTYFLSLEREFNNSLRYVEYTKKQESVFSHEFARLILLTCSEIDVLFKIICEHIDKGSKADTIGQYYEVINCKYDIKSEEVNVDRYRLKIYPFKDWLQGKPPRWWTSYNKVKHERHKCFSEANLGNTLYAISGLFVLNLIAFNEYNRISNLFDVPYLLGRDVSPGGIMLENSYRVKLVNPQS